jgi:hypothetical protein
MLKRKPKKLIPLIGLIISWVIAHSVADAKTCSLVLNDGWHLRDASLVADDGASISQVNYPSANWLRATVPGTVLTSLVNDGVYPEPLYGENNLSIPDSLCRHSYWYRTTFIVPADWRGRRIWLHFDGINYRAEVWVTGRKAGDVAGAFARGIFDITDRVRPGTLAAVAVHIFPQPHPGPPHQKTMAAGTGPNGGVSAEDGPTFLCSIGWDWIPTIRDRNTGMWQDVRLTSSGPVVLENPYVTTRLPLPRTDTADVTVQVALSNATDHAQSGLLKGEAEAEIRFERTVALAPHEVRLLTFTPTNAASLHLRHPKLWWPNGYGLQNLYHLKLQFEQGDTISDARTKSFGVRQIGYAVSGSTNLTLVVNGVPIVAKGGDWGMDEAMKRIPRKRLEAMIRMHQQANYTMIRNWVGQSTSEDFYGLCDQYGLLVWDEFFQPCPLDGPNPLDTELYLANVKEKVLRFRSHPCIALWCARNEGNPPPLVDQGLKKLLADLDPARLYQPSSTSGRGVHSGGPYYWRTPKEFYNVDYPFKTEIGSMSVPTLEAIHAMMPEQDWNTINDDWAEHDFCKGAQRGDRYPEMLGKRYGTITTLADFVRKSQLANYEAFRAMYEGRLCRMFHPVTGVITWMSSPAQPSFVWQLYSHDLEPNASLFATRKACEPLHVMLNQDDWRVQVLNNTPGKLNGLKARAIVCALGGTMFTNETKSFTASACSTTDTQLELPPTDAVRFVRLELRDTNNEIISQNFYWQASSTKPDDFRTLNELPQADLEVHANQFVKGDLCQLIVTLRNPAPVVALMAHLQLRRAKSNQRVLPVFYSDNYISLLPGQTRTVTIRASETDLNGEAPLVMLDGWNINVKPVYGKNETVAVAPNLAALTIGTNAPQLNLTFHAAIKTNP